MVYKCICSNTEFYNFNKYSHSLAENIEYIKCKKCGLTIVKDAKNYDLSKIYNDYYFKDVDIGWKGRAELLVKLINLINMFINLKEKQMCDYRAGNGYLAKYLINLGYNILAYEPVIRNNNTFLDKNYYKDKPFPSEVLLMVEIFENFTDAFFDFKKILGDFGYPKFIIFTTFFINRSDKNIVDWWYLNPDAGHFTLWSKKSMEILGDLEGYKLISFSSFFHIFCRKELHKEHILLKLLSIPFNLYLHIKKPLKR